jgi:hypothetical protein
MPPLQCRISARSNLSEIRPVYTPALFGALPLYGKPPYLKTKELKEVYIPPYISIFENKGLIMEGISSPYLHI